MRSSFLAPPTIRSVTGLAVRLELMDPRMDDAGTEKQSAMAPSSMPETLPLVATLLGKEDRLREHPNVVSWPACQSVSKIVSRPFYRNPNKAVAALRAQSSAPGRSRHWAPDGSGSKRWTNHAPRGEGA